VLTTSTFAKFSQASIKATEMDWAWASAFSLPTAYIILGEKDQAYAVAQDAARTSAKIYYKDAMVAARAQGLTCMVAARVDDKESALAIAESERAGITFTDHPIKAVRAGKA
jgi:hypothetical protein